MAKKKQNNSRLYILIGIFFLVTLLTIVTLSKKQSSTNNSQTPSNRSISPDTKTYHSKMLKIAFSQSSTYEIDEQYNTLIIKNNRGQIMVERLYTNLESISSYLDDLKAKNKLLITNKQYPNMGKYDAVLCMIQENQKTYFISPYRGLIYSISTQSQMLYGDLDQIAHTFRYEP